MSRRDLKKVPVGDLRVMPETTTRTTVFRREELIEAVKHPIPPYTAVKLSGKEIEVGLTQEAAECIVDAILAKLSEDDPERVERACQSYFPRWNKMPHWTQESRAEALRKALDAAGPTVVVKELAIDREKAIQAALAAETTDPVDFTPEQLVESIVDAVIECVSPRTGTV